MNEELYIIVKTIDTCVFYSGFLATVVLTLKAKLTGIERYKFAIQLASCFLIVLAITNTLITIHKYQELAVEKNGVPDYVPVIAALICVIIFASIIGALWLIYFILKKKKKKSKK